LNAPIEKVWQAWTNPEILKQWWGPNDVIIPECEVDLRVGGEVYIVMEAGEAMGPYKGTRWPMRGIYMVIEENSKLTYATKAWTEGQEETTEIDQVTEMTLSYDDGKTTVKIKVTINKIGPGAGMALEGMKYGFTQQLEKLDTYFKA
jgi:uncharacterized protein YndB with AHSA1/START domain